MSQPYVGEIRLGGWSFAPVNYAMCNGASVEISQNEALFALIGTTYGGNGVTTFNLPDMRGRIPVHIGSGFVEGQVAGSEQVTVTVQQMPNHNHTILASAAAATTGNPNGQAPAATTGTTFVYNPAGAPVQMANVIGPYGGSQPHENRMPFLAVTFIIALYGVFPARN